MDRFVVGSLVRCRDREWVVLPSEQRDVLYLRPLGGSEAEVCGVYLPLEERDIQPARFAPPDPRLAGDFDSGALLRDAVRLSLRSGAGPFRSLGRLGVRPRPYQLVPLIMALRLPTVRLLIADDVGIGKTIEAGLIARELFDRGEIRRLAVLCPPHLCDQWQRELAEKFGFDAVIVRSSTAAALERQLPRGDASIFDHYPITVVSIDYIKSSRHRPAFVRSCPELVIVDEAHTAASATGRAAGQHQRHALVREIADNPQRHLLLLTATPHSGIEDAFRSLLGLLRPHFATFDLQHLSEAQRDELARHFVQRQRGDVQIWLGENTPFPRRESREEFYTLAEAPDYRRLFQDVYDFARELVRRSPASGQPASRQRVRYWAALALLRCVMSSPAAAQKALAMRAARDGRDRLFEHAPDLEQEDSDLFGDSIYDRTAPEAVNDLEPGQALDDDDNVLRGERARLMRFAERAAALRGAGDPKLQRARAIVCHLLRADYHPILFCRYIETAKYVADELRALREEFPDLDVRVVTGELTEEEREAVVADLSASARRLLVATDCLSEGINLQHSFDAVVHYDLPWNPNRLEQREGRVDRYGQRRDTVRVALLYGRDNPMDEAVMTVLLRKALRIHRTLRIAVPLPVDSETVIDALVTKLFHSGAQQLSFEDIQALDAAEQTLREADILWDRSVERERQSRSRFAQRAIKPEEVARELEESEAVLGDPHTVQRFVRAACERLHAPLTSVRSGDQTLWRVHVAGLPQPVRERLASVLHRGRSASEHLLIAFEGAPPEGAHLVNRNHPLVAALADHLLECALLPAELLVEPPPAARSSLIRSTAVQRRTVLLLLRVRMLIRTPDDTAPLLAEELLVCGYQGRPGALDWLAEAEALRLLETARPAANVSVEERRLALERVLAEELPHLEDELRARVVQRARRLDDAHYRVRMATRRGRGHVEPHLPADLLGVYLILPVPTSL